MKPQDINLIKHYQACLLAIQSICNNNMAIKNPSACIEAINEFIKNEKYNRP
jgi:hypothetical protein